MKKQKELFLKLSILVIFLIVIFLGTKGMIRKLEPTRILEIPDSRLCEDSLELGFVAATRYTMIINPPKNSEELKELMLDYCKKNKQIIEDIGGYKSEIKNIRYIILFYKEGRGFTRKWKPDLEEQSGIIDLMQNYANYCLGSVVYESKGSDIEILVKEWVGDEIEDKEYTVPISFLTE